LQEYNRVSILKNIGCRVQANDNTDVLRRMFGSYYRDLIAYDLLKNGFHILGFVLRFSF
jgi:hypothetical protein